MDSGRKFDKGRDRWDLLHVGAAREIVKVLTYGAEKYTLRDESGKVLSDGANNWKLVPDRRRRYYAAMLRHLTAWWEGERIDSESGMHHLGHALCCGVFLLAEDLDEGKEKREAVEDSETE